MNHIHFFTNFIPQSFVQLAHLVQTQNPVMCTVRNESVSAVAIARISDANTSSPAHSLSCKQTALERFEEELHLWCEEKSGTHEYRYRYIANLNMIECFKTSSAKLNLSNMYLTSLPSAICMLTSLLELDLENNKFTLLPSAIGSLKGLHYLNVSRNHLISLPDSIGLLTRLSELNLCVNRLNSLPSTIGSLRSLYYLNASCNHLTSLPDSIGLLTRLSKLCLSSNQLTSIPDATSSLTSLRDLRLSDNQFTSFSFRAGSFTRLQNLDLFNNPLTALPDSILTLPHNCRVDLSNTALSVRVLTHLREETARALYQGPQFFYSMPTLRMPQEQPLATIISELYRIIGRPSRAFPKLEAIDQQQHLRSWLNRLSGTATYQRSGDAKRQFVSQIVRYLETAEENEEFQNILMPILDDASQTCGDRVALSILHVGVGHRLHHFDLSDPKSLSQFLICGPMTLSILEQYARELIPTLRFVDDIEVYLGLPVMLKDRLSIPIDVSEMLYFRCSNLNSSHLDAAAARVRGQIDDLGTRYQFLIGQPKWLEALEKRFPSEMAAFQEEYLQKLESASDPLSVRSEYEGHLKTLTKQLLQE